jgi:CHAT domain-containing protein
MADQEAKRCRNSLARSSTPVAGGVVVSPWAVPSEETTLLITRTVEELEHDRNAGMAESMRGAMVSLMTSSERPELAHPMFWAPFLLVGDGDGGPR